MCKWIGPYVLEERDYSNGNVEGTYFLPRSHMTPVLKWAEVIFAEAPLGPMALQCALEHFIVDHRCRNGFFGYGADNLGFNSTSSPRTVMWCLRILNRRARVCGQVSEGLTIQAAHRNSKWRIWRLNRALKGKSLILFRQCPALNMIKALYRRLNTVLERCLFGSPKKKELER